MEEGKTSEDLSAGKTKLFFILGFVFLFALALTWSIDSSFFYIFLGGSTICFYLGFRSRSGSSSVEKRDDYKTQTERDVESHLSEELKSIFKKQESSYRPTNTSVKSIIRRITLIFVGVMALTFIAVLVAVLSNNDEFDVDTFYQQAGQFYTAGQYDSALFYYRKALDINKEYPEALTGYGNTLLMKNENDSALYWYDKALVVDPDFEEAKYQKGLVHFYQNKYDQSIIELKELLEQNSAYFDAMQVIGDDYYNQKKYDSALHWYDGAYANGVRNRYLCHLMGYIYQTRGNNSKAITLYQEALSYDSTVVDIYIRLGELLPGSEGDFYRRKATALQPANTNPN